MIDPVKMMQSAVAAAVLVFAGATFADNNPTQPLQLAQAAGDFDVEATYMRTCFACHNAGAGGAPRMDDAAAWNTRMEKGMDTVMQNVINGVNAMPAKGLCFDCSDDNLRAVVQYMFETATAQ